MYILCDIGGTKMRVARVNNVHAQQPFVKTIILSTPPLYEQGVKVLVQNILQLQESQGDSIDACVVAIAGSLNGDKSEIYNSPNLQGWEHQPLKKRLENELHCHVHIENDAALAGLGEARYGAGKGDSIVAYLTISTGTGGVRIVDGCIDAHTAGFEPGRQIIKADDVHKSLGRYISGAELQRTYGASPENILDTQVWNDVARYLAYGIYNTVMFWSPHVVVLGGGLIMHEAIQLDKVYSHFMERMKHTGTDVFPFIPKIVKAELADIGGLYGGLAYIRNRMSHFE